MKEEFIEDYIQRSGDAGCTEDRLKTHGRLTEFEWGWVQYNVTEQKEFKIISLYKNSTYKDQYSSADIWEALKAAAKWHGCDKIIGLTRRNPKVWKRAYGIELSHYVIVYDLNKDG